MERKHKEVVRDEEYKTKEKAFKDYFEEIQ